MKIEISKHHQCGYALYINDYRVAGSKPWGGGVLVAAWDVKLKDILKGIERPERSTLPHANKMVKARTYEQGAEECQWTQAKNSWHAMTGCGYLMGGINHKGECPYCERAIRAESSTLPRTYEQGAEEQVLSLTADNAARWRDRGDDYWLARLMQEVGELASSLVGDHEDPPEHELRQVASIALNWLDKRLRALPTTPKDAEAEIGNGGAIDDDGDMSA